VDLLLGRIVVGSDDVTVLCVVWVTLYNIIKIFYYTFFCSSYIAY
jgi:hypothetical protein